MKKQNFQSKKVLHFLIILFLLLALGFGIIFSSLETSHGLKLGAQYRGGYQAVVGVYDVAKNDEENKTNLPNGDSKTGAGILEAKLSPFADGSINVTIDGKFRLIVTAPRDSYSNNQQLFVNAIQSTGGLFVFTDKYEDVMLDSTLMGKAGLTGTIEDKSPTSALLGNVTQTSRQAGITNRPFLEFDLPGGTFTKMVAVESSGGSTTPPNLAMVVDTPTVLDTIRNYFLFANSDQLDNYLETFRTEVLKPLKEGIERGITTSTDPNAISGDAATVIRDFFQVTYWEQNIANNWEEKVDSLVNPTFIDRYLEGNLDDFKALIFADQDSNHQLKYRNEVTKYTYDSNAKKEDFASGGRYYNPLRIDNNSTEIKVNQAFNYLTKNLFGTCLLDQQNQVNPANNPAGIKDKFNQSLFADYFIYYGGPTSGGATGSLPPVNGGSVVGSKFYIGTKNYTVAKKAAALISQTGSGITFHVLSVTAVDAIITNTMFIVSMVALLIVVIAIALFILFFYRLLGLFTIIIAAIIASLTLLMSVVFGITIGPEIIAIMFVLMGIVMDISVVMFEAFKNNIYLEKRPLVASFNISNRETLGLVIDVILASLLPNIVLFWIGVGFLKNFATILTLGIFFVFLFGVVVLRLLIYFTTHTNWLKKYPWMLPVDTSLNYDGRFINHYLLLLNQEKLDSYTGKTHLSSQQLIKIQRLEQRIQNLQTKDQVFIQKRQKKKQLRNLKFQKKWKKQLQVLIEKRKNLNYQKRWSYFWVSHYNKKIDYYSYLVGDETVNGSTAILNDQLTRVEKNTTKIGGITFAVTIFVTILALILAFTIGLNYSVNYGQGTQFYIYGTYVTSTYNTLAAPDGLPRLNNPSEQDKAKVDQIVADLKKIHEQSKISVLQDNNVDPNAGAEITRPYENEWQALGVYQAYRYMISHDYMQYLASNLARTNFKDATFMYGANYSKIDPTNSSYVDAPWVAIVTTNNLIPQNNAIKLAFQTFAGNPSGSRIPEDPDNEKGTLGMTLEPHTATTQIKQIGITFGIILLALLVYMLIRFKWTYYVALALGLVLTMALTISLVVVFRIPFSIEALAGILGVIGFASITGMLFLGRGKSIIASKDEKVLNHHFDQEIKLQAQKKQLKLQTKKKIQALKKTHRQQLKALDSKAENFHQQHRQLKKTQASELKQLRNQEKIALKKQFTEINAQIKLEARKNNFLKEIFANVLRFGLLRTVFLSSFYLVIGIITAVTLPSIGVMGFILTVGVIASTLIMITIVLPIWIQLERRRIRLKYGYKKFVNNLQVTSEEQIIAGLND